MAEANQASEESKVTGNKVQIPSEETKKTLPTEPSSAAAQQEEEDKVASGEDDCDDEEEENKNEPPKPTKIID